MTPHLHAEHVPGCYRCDLSADEAMPRRVQLRRTKGYRKPEDAIVVARPSAWGNPFPVKGDWIMWTAVGLGYTGDLAGRRRAAVALHRAWITDSPVILGPLAGDTRGGSIEFSDGTSTTFNDHVRGFASFAAVLMGESPTIPARPDLDALRGHDLACWCPLDEWCHADTLLDLANTEREPVGAASAHIGRSES